MSDENAAPANCRPLAALFMMLAVAFVFVGLLAAIVVVGPGRAIDSVSAYLIPTMVILGVVFVVAWALLVWALKRLPDPPYRDR